MNVYLDASVIVPLFSRDKFSDRARALLAGTESGVVVSDFACAEFASVIAVKFRRRELTTEKAQMAFGVFDSWTQTETRREALATEDLLQATRVIRRLDFNLRAPDAIHIAIAHRLGATLATFDERMAECARALGLDVAAI